MVWQCMCHDRSSFCDQWSALNASCWSPFLNLKMWVVFRMSAIPFLGHPTFDPYPKSSHYVTDSHWHGRRTQQNLAENALKMRSDWLPVGLSEASTSHRLDSLEWLRCSKRTDSVPMMVFGRRGVRQGAESNLLKAHSGTRTNCHFLIRTSKSGNQTSSTIKLIWEKTHCSGPSSNSWVCRSYQGCASGSVVSGVSPLAVLKR
jgi:hypothetical protein